MPDRRCYPDDENRTFRRRPPPQMPQDGREEDRHCGDDASPRGRRHQRGDAAPRPEHQEYSQRRVHTLGLNLARCDGPSVTIETAVWVPGWNRPPAKSARRTLYPSTTRPLATC